MSDKCSKCGKPPGSVYGIAMHLVDGQCFSCVCPPSAETIAAFDTFRPGVLCRFCDGRDVHQCPGGWTRRPRSENAFSLSSNGEERVFPGMLDARAYPREQIEAQLTAMYAYELAGSEEGSRELLRSTEPPECERCGVIDCTKNHAEFM